MKKIHIALLLLAAFFISGCNNNTQVYGNLLKEEKKKIANYISRNNINILKEVPEDGNWNENDYVEIDDYLYFHLVSAGDSESDPIAYRDYIALRYRKISLDEYADTISIWNTSDSANPVEFQYGVSSSAVCEGWMEAISYMKYNNSVCRIICPSKLGFDEDATSVTPYVYDLKIKIRK